MPNWKQWNTDEIEQLIKLVNDGTSRAVISKTLNRTIDSVKSKIKGLKNVLGTEKLDVTKTDDKTFKQIIQTDGELNKTYELLRRLTNVQKKVDAAASRAAIISELFKDASQVIEPPPKIKLPNELRTDINKEEALLILSDQHIGEVVDEEEMNGKNKYNMKIAEERLNNIANNTADIVKDKLRGYSLETLHIAFLGDSISGEIHDELALNLECPLPRLLIRTGTMFAHTVSELSRVFKHVKVYCVVGNHGRNTKEQNFKQRINNNFELVVYEIMKEKLSAHKNITIEIPKSDKFIITINGHKCLLYHGTDIKGNGVPYMGCVKYLNSLKTSDFDFKSAFIGHFHTSCSFDYGQGKVFFNGSLKGADEYSSGKMGIVLARPKQWLVGVHPKRITWQFELECDHK